MAEILKDRNWYDTAWRSRAKITINKDLAVGTTQANYPVKITNLDHVIYGLSKADGSDLLFTYQNEPIRRDVVSFDRSARTCEIYVELPSLSGSVDTVIYCYFNNPDATLLNDRVDHSITRSVRVAASADDSLCYNDAVNWLFTLTSTYDIVGYENATFLKIGSGLRFLNTLVPLSSTINQSYVRFTCKTDDALNTVNSRLCIELGATPSTFSTLADYQARRGTACGGADDTHHTATIDWDGIAGWVAETEYDSPSLNTPMQTAINTNAMQHTVVFWEDHDNRSTNLDDRYRLPYSYNGSATKCPLLILDFTPDLTNYQTLELEYTGIKPLPIEV